MHPIDPSGRGTSGRTAVCRCPVRCPGRRGDAKGAEVRRRQPRAIRLVAAGSLVVSAVLAALAPGASAPQFLVVLVAGLGLAARELLDVAPPLPPRRARRVP